MDTKTHTHILIQRHQFTKLGTYNARGGKKKGRPSRCPIVLWLNSEGEKKDAYTEMSFEL